MARLASPYGLFCETPFFVAVRTPVLRVWPVWIQVSCPKCGMNAWINSRGSCKVCRAVLIYAAAQRVKSVTIAGRVAFRWYPDQDGRETVMVDDGRSITQERGCWMRCQGVSVIFDRPDRRRTAQVRP